MIRVQPYQPRIPIGHGGGVIDLSSKENETKMLIAEALGEILGKVARGKQREEPPNMKIIVGDGKTWLVNPATGEKRDLGIAPPRSRVGDRNITDIINDISKISGAAEKIPSEALEQPIIDAAIRPLRQELMEETDFEEVPGREVRRTKPHWYLPGFMEDWLAPDITAAKGGKVVRKKTPITKALEEPSVRRKVKGKGTRPPKPKEYPDAKWSEEHQMWTIVKNGRLMGVK